jgi:hypothetical protein
MSFTATFASCPTCIKTQPWDFYVLKGNAYVDHDSADIVCRECKSVLTSLYSDQKVHPARYLAGSARRVGVPTHSNQPP